MHTEACHVWFGGQVPFVEFVQCRGLIDEEEDTLEGEALGYSRNEIHLWVIPETRCTSGLFHT